jgi:hypothetical protein
VVVGGDPGWTPAALEEEGNGESGPTWRFTVGGWLPPKRGGGGTFVTESDELRRLGVDNEC